ncbi:penicillin-binding protein 2 [Haematospirillum jordaniae]|uniref:penicillin-binding protein 2 n=1 Tax=Haematospirillum jordaniae TaxID=1549855 RepID=UPI000AEB3E92|nr:penicillin-binding protein 2 [Haematospirillum jordaniae]
MASSTLGGARREQDLTRLFTRRIAVLGAGKAALLATLVGRMYFLQVVEAEKYATLAEENRINLRLLPPPRGQIVDRFGVPMAVNQQNFRALIISEQTPDLAGTLDRFGRIVPLGEGDKTRVLREVRRKRRFVPVPVRENLTWEEMARIQVNAPDLPGVFIDEGLARYYPFGAEASHVLGYVAAVSEEDLVGSEDPLLDLPGFRIGKAGLERQFDRALRGTGGTLQVEVNAVGRVIRELARVDGQTGSELALSIDSRIQDFACKAIGDESGTVVVMDVMTGELLALASQPGYDPNAFSRGLTAEEWKALTGNPKGPLANKPIAGQYAPGSVFKMIVLLAALEAGVIRPEQTVYCPGSFTLGTAKFHCWRKQGHGHVDMVGSVRHSCDVYFYEVGRRLGIDRIADMARRFGLGTLTGIDLPGEKPGLIPDRGWKQAVMGDVWHPGESVVAAIGQGYITATPLQLAMMTARIANGGLAVHPTLSRVTVNSQGSLVPRVPTPGPDMGIPAAHMQLVQRAMWEAVNADGGTARRARLPSDLGEMAGKTGTAQVRRISRAERETGVIKNEHLPWERRDHALFVCYAPVSTPRYAVAVVIEHGGGGAAMAAPIARSVMAETLRLDPARSAQPVTAQATSVSEESFPVEPDEMPSLDVETQNGRGG